MRLIIFLLLIVIVGNGQTKTDLEKEKEKLKEEIEFVNKLLKETEQKSQTSVYQINALQKKIEIRKSLIEKMSSEIYSINRRIDALKEKSSLLKEEISILKDNYGKTLRNTYKSSSHKKNKILVFIISSKNLYQAFKRYIYIRYLLEEQKKKYNKILSLNQNYVSTINELEFILNRKTSLLKSENTEKNTLEKEEEQEKYLITEIYQKKSELQKKLAIIGEQTEKLEQKIREIIAQEVALAKKKEYHDKTENERNMSITSSFEKEKGKLVWPSKNVFLYMGYGKQKDPILKSIEKENPGITLGTDKNAEVFCMYDGEVSNIIIIPGSNISVIIKHGDYFTTYSNLEKVSVSKGQHIKKGEKLGYVHYDKEENKSLLNILIYKGFKQLDPSEWIYKIR